MVTLFNRKLQMFQKLAKLGIFGIFNKLLSTQYENIARFARNVECNLCNFQAQWPLLIFSHCHSGSNSPKKSHET